jgi:hypothetical protein
MPTATPTHTATPTATPIAPASVAGSSNRVWLEKLEDGLFDETAGETGVPGVTVTLMSVSPAALARPDDALATDAELAAYAATAIMTTTTDANGVYTFTGIAPGAYMIKVARPVNRQFTIKDRFGNAGSFDMIDSDVDKFGVSSAFTLAPGEIKDNLAAGMLIRYGIYLPIVTKPSGASSLQYDDDAGFDQVSEIPSDHRPF